MPDPIPIDLVATFSTDLTAVPAGQGFTLQAVTGAARVYVDLGTGDGPQETAGQLWEYPRAGNYRLTVIDAADLGRRRELPVTVVPGTPALSLTTTYPVNTAAQFAAAGVDGPDNHLGICRVPGGTDDDLYFYGHWWDPADGHLGIARLRGTTHDMLASGAVVLTKIAGNPFPPFPQAYLMPGPMHVVQRAGRPDLVLTAALLAETHPTAGTTYGSVHLLASEDYETFRYVGELWRHGVDKTAYMTTLDPASYTGMNGGSSLLWVADGSGVEHQGWLYFPHSAANGPTHGPGGTAANFVPLTLARVWLPALLAALDSGAPITPLVEKWYQDGWNSRYDGPASPLPGASSLLGRFAPQFVWCGDVGLYLAIGQSAGTSDGNVVWLQTAPNPEGPWSAPQAVGRFGVGAAEAAPCPTPITPDGTVGSTFQVWAEVYDSATNGPVRWDGLTVRLGTDGH